MHIRVVINITPPQKNERYIFLYFLGYCVFFPLLFAASFICDGNAVQVKHRSDSASNPLIVPLVDISSDDTADSLFAHVVFLDPDKQIDR